MCGGVTTGTAPLALKEETPHQRGFSFMIAKRRKYWCFCGDVAGNVSTFPALPSIQPAEGAAQFGDAVFVITAAMREDDAFRLPGKDVR